MTRYRLILRHIFYISASILLAIFIVSSGAVHEFLEAVGGYAHVGSFLAGIFFTSIFTTAPAVVILGELSLEAPPLVVAISGGLGAVVGDYILFMVVRDGLSRDVEYLLAHSGLQRFRKMFRTKLVQHVLPVVGALVLASPLPDELGLVLLGFSKINKDRFLLISFIMNALGILVIGLIARLFS